MKVHVKKKLYRLSCNSQRLKGNINSADGIWTDANSLERAGRLSGSSKQMILSGVAHRKV